MKPIRHRPVTWAKLYDLTIYDPDGWRHDNKSFNAPIDEKEWYARMTFSTCIFGKTAFDLMQKAEKRLYEGIKIVSTSDLHGELDFECPSGDFLTISGDICPVRASHHPVAQENWIKNHFLPWCDGLIKDHSFKHILFCNGNHDFYFEKLMKDNKEDSFRETLPNGVHYLRDSMVEIDGIKIYGTPFTTIFSSWANMASEEVLDQIYSKIPEGLDILLSHGPAYGWNDMIEQYPERCWEDDKHIGSKSLRKHILRALPRWSCFGHIHSGSHKVNTIPMLVDDTWTRKEINTVNVSLLDEDYKIAYPPTTFVINKE